MEMTSEKTPVTPGDLLEVARGLRKLGVAGFSFRGCTVTFYDPLPLELQETSTAAPQEKVDEEEEPQDKKLARLRKEQADADLYGSS
jgi:hypothetical protein